MKANGLKTPEVPGFHVAITSKNKQINEADVVDNFQINILQELFLNTRRKNRQRIEGRK